MKKRFKKKTQKQLGYVTIGAWVRPSLREALCRRAHRRGTSITDEIVAAVEAITEGET